MLIGCFPALVSRQVVEGHRGRMREAVWVPLWSDILFLSYLHMHSHVLHKLPSGCRYVTLTVDRKTHILAEVLSPLP